MSAIFNIGTFYQNVPDPRYTLLQGLASVDYSTTATIDNNISPISGRGTLFFNDAQAGAPTMFELATSPDSLENLPAYSLVITFKPVERLIAAPNTLVDWTAESSLPYHTAWAMTNPVLKLNKTQRVVESYQNTKYSESRYCRDAKERASDQLESDNMENFVPYNETIWDTAAAFSPETVARALPLIAVHAITLGGRITKIIPFASLFSCCNVPGFWVNIEKISLDITFRRSDLIPFKLAALALYDPHMYIEQVRVIKTAQRMSPPTAQEISLDRQKNEPINISFSYFNIQTSTYQTNADVRIGSQPNVQSSAFFIQGPDYMYAAEVKLNRMQTFRGALTNMWLNYGNENFPTDGVEIATNQMVAYSYFQKATKQFNMKRILPGIRSLEYSDQHHETGGTFHSGTKFIGWINIADTDSPTPRAENREVIWKLQGAAMAAGGDPIHIMTEQLWSIRIGSDYQVAKWP